MKKQTLTAELTAKIEELATNAFNRAVAENRSICIAQDKASFEFFFVGDFSKNKALHAGMKAWNDCYLKLQRTASDKKLKESGFWDKVSADYKEKFGE